MESQTTDNLRGEVAFRKLLARQHVTGEMLLSDYFCKEEHDGILRERVATTIRDIEKLGEQGVRLSPFLELGAERCHRSLVLTNDFGADGIAIDISHDQLKTAGHFSELLGRPRLPLRVCCDVNHLPIRDSSVPFAFCYEFLHHFPAVKPVLDQVYRILSQGIFFFNEEPFKRPRMTLYRQQHKMYSKHSLRRSKLVRALESFIADPWSDELEHGIIENDRISVREWLDALAIFDSKSVMLASVGGRMASRLTDRIRIANRLNILLGGGISGTCTKNRPDISCVPKQLTDLLLCPNCLATGSGRIDAPLPLNQLADSFLCPVCDSAYPVVDGVVLLLRTGLFRELYPEYAP